MKYLKGLLKRFCYCLVTKLCPTLRNPMDCSTPDCSVPHHLLEFMQVHVQWIGDAIQPSNLLSPSSPSAFNLPQYRVFSNELTFRIRWLEYWNLSLNISPSNEYSGLISFKVDWFDLLTVQGTLKSLLQHHSLKASIIWLSAFFIIQFSHLYMTTGKTIALTRWTFVS